MAQKELVALALKEQQAIGWHLCFRGYLSRHWALAVAAHPSPPVPRKQSNAKPNNFGSTWSQTTVSELWDFTRTMWVHRNSFLHDPTSLECCQLKGAELIPSPLRTAGASTCLLHSVSVSAPASPLETDG